MRMRWIAPFLASTALATGAIAQDTVQIRTNDGSVVISGQILSFEDGFYEIQSAVGVLRIPSEVATCEGAACPPPPKLASEFKITTASVVGGDLIMRLIGGYASDLKANVFIDFDAAARQMNVKLQDEAEETDLAEIALARGAAEDAFRGLLEGTSQIVLASRRATEAEASFFVNAGLADVISPEREVVLALDGVAVVVSPDNALRSIALEEIAAVYAGEITNWSDLGGPNAPIRLILSNEDAEMAAFFEDDVLGAQGVSLSTTVEAMATDQDVIAATEADATAIGVTSVTAVEDANALPIRLSCGLTADPSTFSVKSEEYPLARRLFLYSRGDDLPEGAVGLIDYARSNAGQENVADVGLVDQGITMRRLSDIGGRIATALVDAPDVDSLTQLRNMAVELIDANQLSTTLRFRTASAQLDSKAAQDIQRLAALFASPDYADQEIILAGFTDSVGRLDLNVVLANRRAEQVKNSIIEASGGALASDAIRTLGYGPTAPVGCNDSLAGRQSNRRVEVWIRDRS